MSYLTETLRQELAALETEVQQDPRFIKIARIKSLLELYPPEPVSHVEPSPPSAAEVQTGLPEIEGGEPKNIEELVASEIIKNTGNGRAESKASQIKSRVRGLLHGGRRLHRSAILDNLAGAGLMGRESNPIASLAAYLSEWREEFASDGRGNFWLREQSEDVREHRSGAEAPDLLEDADA